MASGWSWDPATVLGNVDANRMNWRSDSTPATAHRVSLSQPIQPSFATLGGENTPLALSGKTSASRPVATPIPAPSRASLASVQLQSPAQPVATSASGAKKRASTSKKRKSDTVVEPERATGDNDENSHQGPNLNCDEIRTKIRGLVDSGAMKVGQLQQAIDVSSVVYHRFMKQNGPDAGSGSTVYSSALKYFKEKDSPVVQAPAPKRSKSSAGEKASASKASGGKTMDALDTGDVKLDGEDDGLVPVFDTCDEVRKKIRAILKKDGVTQAAFCREAGKCLTDGQSMQSRQVAAFLAKQGPTEGNTSCVFYGSYVFFEKLRVKQGKPKSAMRLEMEKLYPGNDDERRDKRPGMNTTDLRKSLWLHDSESAYVDKYGKTHIVKKGGGRR